MKYMLSFSFSFIRVLALFAITYFAIALMADLSGLTGLSATILYSLPLVAYIAWSTSDSWREARSRFFWICCWFYSVLVACAGIALWIAAS